jgi:xylulokinase
LQIYIEGDNLEVLKLLQETNLGKIKMIYIDPPYNTGSDLGVQIDTSKICGGGTKNIQWVKIIASVLNINILLPKNEHGAVLGAALLGANACLTADEYERLKTSIEPDYVRITPNNQLVKYYNEKYGKWIKLYPKIKE